MAAAPAGARAQRVIFFSDVHVDPAVPEKTAALLDFLDRVRAEGYERAFILGDLFEFWVGRGHEALRGFAEVLERLSRLVQSGCEVAIVHGNRDFHLGAEVARATSAAILPDGATLRIGDAAVRVTHGDRLCLRDTGYQTMRRLIRSRLARRWFLALPLGTRLRIARAMRRRSVRAVRAKAAARPGSFAIVPSAVRRLFRDGADVAVVGHVHRARRIELQVRGRPRFLFTLGSWDDGNRSYLDLRDGVFTLHDGPLAERVLVGLR